jgi:hypothetical protein
MVTVMETHHTIVMALVVAGRLAARERALSEMKNRVIALLLDLTIVIVIAIAKR